MLSNISSRFEAKIRIQSLKRAKDFIEICSGILPSSYIPKDRKRTKRINILLQGLFVQPPNHHPPPNKGRK